MFRSLTWLLFDVSASLMFVVYAELLSGYVKCSNKLRSGLGTQHSAARRQTEIVNGAHPGPV